MKSAGHVTRLAELRKANILVRTTEDKRPLGIYCYEMEGIIKMEVRGTVCGNVSWIRVYPDEIQFPGLVITVTNLWIPLAGRVFFYHLLKLFLHGAVEITQRQV
jgi:hypothetical protein